MTKLFDHAVDAVRALPPAAQDDLARLLLQLAGEEQPPVSPSAAETASFAKSLAQSAGSERATDD